jgi:tetratricopeptide (TPR) repeat protein
VKVRAFLALAFALGTCGAAVPQSAAGGDAVRLYEQGLSRQLAEDYTGAVESYRAALRANVAYVLPMVGLAECFYALGEQDEALKWVGEARKGDRRSLELPVLEARVRTAMSDFAQARAILKAVLTQASNDVQARLALARVEVADGNRREAVVQLEQAVAAAPDNPEALLELSRGYEALGQPEKADPFLRRALDRYSEDPRIHLAAGRALLDRGDLAGARRSLERALSIKPGYTDAYLALATLHLAAGRPREAADAARQALAAADPRGRAEARYLAGAAAAGLGDVADALRQYAEAIRLAPDDEIPRIAAENLALRRPRESESVRKELARYHGREGSRQEERNFLPLALLEMRRALRLDAEARDTRRAYAGVYVLRGFPIRALNELVLLRDFYGVKDPAVADSIEAGCSGLADTPASRWIERLGSLKGCDTIADQYGLSRAPAVLAVLTVAGASRESRFGAAAELADYSRDLMLRYDHLKVADAPLAAASIEAAQAAARQAGSDYYAVISFVEEERSIRATADVHLTRTGQKLASASQLRTGNNRARDALARLADQVAALIPVRGVIVAREFDRALIDLGKLHDLAPDAKLVIVRRNALGTSNTEIAWSWRDQDVLGELTVTAVDERVAEGMIKPRSFFDLVNPGDFVILAPKKPAAN